MTVVKASYTRQGGIAKDAVRYIESRPGRERAKMQRTLFNADGKVQRQEVYAMIDQADQGCYFFRLVISPDPCGEDRDRELSLRDITERTIQSLEARFQRPLQWVGAIHADHAGHRHVHALAILPERLQKQDLDRLREAATEAALEQVQQLALARKERERVQEELSW